MFLNFSNLSLYIIGIENRKIQNYPARHLMLDLSNQWQTGNYFSGMSGGWVAGLFGNITNSAPNWVELGLG